MGKGADNRSAGSRKKSATPQSGGAASGLGTAASLGRRIGVHRGSVTRAIKRVMGSAKTKLGHQHTLTPAQQSRIAAAIKKGGKKKG